MASLLDRAKSAITTGGAAIGAGVGTAYDYLTPGKGSNRLTNATSAYFAPIPASSAPRTSPTAVKAPTGGTDYAALIANSKATSDALSKQIAALQYQMAQQPRLPFFDSSANYAQAQAKAQGIVNPAYIDKMNLILQKYNTLRGQKTEETTRSKEDIATALSQALQDSNVTRGRTSEDVATQLEDTAATEQNYQTTEGTAFDQAYRALAGQVADSGLATSGIGQQQTSQAIKERNTASGEQERQFQNERDATNLFKTRKFEDLASADTRATGSAGRKTEQADIDLRNYIDNQNISQKGEEFQTEQDRQSALFQATTQQAKLGVNDFIAGLIRSGARAQDIAIAQQVYGA